MISLLFFAASLGIPITLDAIGFYPAFCTVFAASATAPRWRIHVAFFIGVAGAVVSYGLLGGTQVYPTNAAALIVTYFGGTLGLACSAVWLSGADWRSAVLTSGLLCIAATAGAIGTSYADAERGHQANAWLIGGHEELTHPDFVIRFLPTQTDDFGRGFVWSWAAFGTLWSAAIRQNSGVLIEWDRSGGPEAACAINEDSSVARTAVEDLIRQYWERNLRATLPIPRPDLTDYVLARVVVCVATSVEEAHQHHSSGCADQCERSDQ